MSESRNKFYDKFLDKNKKEIAVQASSLSILPAWYPLYAKSLYQRSQILESKVPGNLSHSTFFANKHNYYRGITTNLCLQPLFPAAEWLLTMLLTKIKEINQRDPILAEKLAAGFITGASTVVVANPVEATIIASQNYKEPPYKSFLRILNTAGLKGLYTGVLPMAIRNGTFVSGLFVTTPEIKKIVEQKLPGSGKAHQIASTALGAAIPALLFTSVAIPFDLAAIMRQSDPSQQKFTSTVQALQKAYAKHGLSTLKAGALFRLCASVIEMTGFNLLNQEYNQLLSTPRPK